MWAWWPQGDGPLYSLQFRGLDDSIPAAQSPWPPIREEAAQLHPRNEQSCTSCARTQEQEYDNNTRFPITVRKHILG